MERYQLVRHALNDIEEKHRLFFESTNTDIIKYVHIEPNDTQDWINVWVKDGSGLPPQLIEDIQYTFEIVK